MARDDHSSKTHPPLKDKPGKNNWVENNAVRDRLPSYIERIARHLVADEGYTESRAIATAKNTVAIWATGFNHNGSKVSAKTQAKAIKALAQWEAMAASAKSKKKGNKVRNLVRDFFTWLQEPVGSRPVELAKKTESKKSNDKKEWAHGFVPLTPKAARIKDHRAKGSASDAPTPVKGSDDYNQLSAKQRREVDAKVSGKKSSKSDESEVKDKAEDKPKADPGKEKAKKEREKANRIPDAVWRGRAQRLAKLSETSLKRSLASKSDAELTAIRRAIRQINDHGGTSTDSGQTFANLIGALDKEYDKREPKRKRARD